MRQAAKEAVVQSRNKIANVDLNKTDIPGESENAMRIYEHLTPKKQDLLKSAKLFQRESNNQILLGQETEISTS